MAEQDNEKILRDELLSRFLAQFLDMEAAIQAATRLMDILKTSQEDIIYRTQELLNSDALSNEAEMKTILVNLLERSDEYIKEIEELLAPIEVMRKAQEELDNKISELCVDDSTTEDEDEASTSGSGPQNNVTEAVAAENKASAEEEELKEPKYAEEIKDLQATIQEEVEVPDTDVMEATAEAENKESVEKEHKSLNKD